MSIFCTVVIYEYFLVDQYRFYSTDLMHCFLTSGDNGWLCIYSTIDLFSCDFSWMKHFTRHFCLLQKDKIYIYILDPINNLYFRITLFPDFSFSNVRLFRIFPSTFPYFAQVNQRFNHSYPTKLKKKKKKWIKKEKII